MLRNRELNLSNSSDNTRYQVEINRLQQELDRTKSDDFSNVHRISQLENELNYLRQQETNTLSNPDNREIDRLLNELNYYRIPRACHWISPLIILIMEKLDPSQDWIICKGDNHTAICNKDMTIIVDILAKPYRYKSAEEVLNAINK